MLQHHGIEQAIACATLLSNRMMRRALPDEDKRLIDDRTLWHMRIHLTHLGRARGWPDLSQIDSGTPDDDNGEHDVVS